MDMTVPPIRRAGTYYIWPGLQDAGNTGVYQQVLDGRKGSCNPKLPWGSGFSAPVGSTISISNTRIPTGVNWITTMSEGASRTRDVFRVGFKNFNQAVLAIELNGVTWDFGSLTWHNVVMEVQTTQTAWCTRAPENYRSSTRYSMTTPRAVTRGRVTTCTIDKVVMIGPA
ncbi:related to putative protein [Rhynchosporium secalis]|uniref:Uncharacterized protein n=1 Tax=Rhynchosporium secalis TaxID=38038 RepID=A0A1E1MS74_RHYSE|nr:related to putative protein [Rhynchosporium secalis]